VDKDQFSVHLRQCRRNLGGITAIARRTMEKRASFELLHEERNAGRVREHVAP
jgi:hypothetical protein